MKNESDFKFIILRYFNVARADEKMRTGQISKESTHLIKIISETVIGKRKFIEIFGNDYNTPDGTAIRDYIHVSDLRIKIQLHISINKLITLSFYSRIFCHQFLYI